MDRGEELILPDEAARAAYELKLTDRAAYDQVMRKQAARLNAMGETVSEIDGRSTEASGVREEDRFDVEAVRAWLAEQGTELAGDVEVQQFGGGASNLTYSLRDGSHDLILRRPPSGQKAKGAHDMGREFRIQDGLREVFPLVPEMVGAVRGRVGDRLRSST